MFLSSGRENKMLIDGRDVGRFGGPPRDVRFGGRLHRVQFDPPPREIMIDGKTCKLKFDGPMPLVVIDGKNHGIR